MEKLKTPAVGRQAKKDVDTSSRNWIDIEVGKKISRWSGDKNFSGIRSY